MEYSIIKVIDENITDREIEQRLGEIALELGIEAFGVTKCRIAWEANGEIEWHDAIKTGWGQEDDFYDFRVLGYALNKAFKGAQACFRSPISGQYFTGHQPSKEEYKEE